MIYEAYRKQNRKITTRYLKKYLLHMSIAQCTLPKSVYFLKYLFNRVFIKKIRGQIRIREKVE